MAKRLIVEGTEAERLLRWLVHEGHGYRLKAGANAIGLRVVGIGAPWTPWGARVEIPGEDGASGPCFDAPDALSRAAWRRVLHGPSVLAPAIVGALTLILFGACAAFLGRLFWGAAAGEATGWPVWASAAGAVGICAMAWDNLFGLLSDFLACEVEIRSDLSAHEALEILRGTDVGRPLRAP